MVIMDQGKLNKLITIIKNGNKKGNITLKYGHGNSLNLAQGGELLVTENGWITVLATDGKTHLINLESVYEIIMDVDLD